MAEVNTLAGRESVSNASGAHAAASSGAIIRLEIVTPEGAALNELVDELTVPSGQGQVGILVGHVPLLADLRTGVVAYRQQGQTSRCAVGDGFLEVVDDHAILLTDKYCDRDSIDIVETRLKWKDLEDTINAWQGAPDDEELARLVANAQWTATLLELFGDPPPAMLHRRFHNEEDLLIDAKTRLAAVVETREEVNIDMRHDAS